MPKINKPKNVQISLWVRYEVWEKASLLVKKGLAPNLSALIKKAIIQYTYTHSELLKKEFLDIAVMQEASLAVGKKAVFLTRGELERSRDWWKGERDKW